LATDTHRQTQTKTKKRTTCCFQAARRNTRKHERRKGISATDARGRLPVTSCQLTGWLRTYGSAPWVTGIAFL